MTSLKEKLVQSIKLIIRGGLIVLNDGLILFPVKKRRIVFESFNGKDINDNPAAIYRQLVNSNSQYRETAYFSVKPSVYADLVRQYPEIKIVKRFHLKWVFLMARSEFWVFNSRLPGWWKKNRDTRYLQTWHGTPLKKLAGDIATVAIPGTTTQQYHQDFATEANRWDYLIAPNPYSETIFRRAFKFHNEILEIGYPRNDVLITQDRPDRVGELKLKLVGNDQATVILYAPTWRDDEAISEGRYQFDLPFDLARFFDHVSEDTVLVIRPHYLVRDRIDISGYEDRVKVLADEDISDLYLIADLLITDYSSVMFDYANLKRPMLFYAYDLEHYRDELRGFYFDYEEHVPGPLVTAEPALLKALDEFTATGNFKAYRSKQRAFYEQFCCWEKGMASQAVVDLIHDKEREND
ncbi:CDP-glycerol glycerophosphotransferase family protein [Levilactobacillus bambusae]|uniref:CDP-glycerol--poly(Glycerophosphate) glycerophosphotransferase n=1 Tax=Levilactobacillus bambusae TaxID=2024736 RepID=A0A2V1N0M4_9LACO|nr:CDP-glycerol glycerophosphotransferase family protein [Levilactobacillus bambusae]PWG00764.1 CDP-glycerol--poly(glycerophosphate) glycerophosphotransferase [Levilactobacillus bambusae]